MIIPTPFSPATCTWSLRLSESFSDALETSGLYQRLVLDGMPTMVWLCRSDGAIAYLNQHAEERLGRTADKLEPWDWLELIHPDERERARRRWQSAFAAGSPYRSEFRMEDPGGTYRWHLAQAVPLKSEGQVGQWVCVWTDIDDLKRAQEVIRASEERFRQIADSIREVFWLTSPEKGEMAYISPAYETIWGRSRERLYAWPRDWLEVIHPDDRERVIESMLTKQTTGEYDEEYRIIRPDGTIRWIRDRAFPVYDPSGGVIRVTGVADDITERRERQAQLRQTEKLEAVAQLAGGVAHDFNNLLVVITGYSQLLMELLARDDPDRELILDIKRAADRAASVTRQLLAFSRKQELALRVLDLADVVRDMDDMLQRVLGENVELTTVLPVDLDPVEADPGQLSQVLLNLAVNARDAMPRGGRLIIEASNVRLEESDVTTGSGIPPGRYVKIEACDTGIGMSDEVRRRVFEPFYTTKDPSEGTGLGLAVVQGIISQCGGYVDVHSEKGSGTCFEIYLPRVASAALPASDESLGPALRGTETIVLVEGDEAVRALTRLVLRRRGYTVLDAADDVEALRIAEEHPGPIDLLLADLHLPGGDVGALLHRLVASSPDMKVLYLAGDSDDAAALQELTEPANCLRKPFSLLVLNRRIREVLDGD